MMAETLATGAIHPKFAELHKELDKRLAQLNPDLEDCNLTARITVRNGIPRKVKWITEHEECL